jgi:hypothetical protein
MKTYPLLTVPLPTISYSILHQSKKEHAGDEYEKTIKVLHDRVRKESNDMKEAYAKGMQDLIVRQAQMVSGLLSQFLTTPIQSDRAEVKRIITEGIEHSLKQGGMVGEVGVVWTSEARTSFPPFKKTLEKKLENNGKAYLQELGFVADGSGGDIHESLFVVEGGLNLDVIEHIVRDRLGIYGVPHGTHLEESASYTFSAYNLVFESGTRPVQEKKKGLVEVSLSFSKPAMEYVPFREALIAGMGQHLAQGGIQYVSLWQRKLGFGRGREFVLRCLCDEVKQLDGIVRWLQEGHKPDFPSEALVERGALLFKEILY